MLLLVQSTDADTKVLFSYDSVLQLSNTVVQQSLKNVHTFSLIAVAKYLVKFLKLIFPSCTRKPYYNRPTGKTVIVKNIYSGNGCFSSYSTPPLSCVFLDKLVTQSYLIFLCLGFFICEIIIPPTS